MQKFSFIPVRGLCIFSSEIYVFVNYLNSQECDEIYHQKLNTEKHWNHYFLCVSVFNFIYN